MTDLTPREIVLELDRFIIGQKDAKRAVAVALRNRWRRKRLGDDLREEVYPKNILMIGPTGVGKTETARWPVAGQAGPGTVPEGRGDQVYRGRLCWPRCGQHHPRSGGYGHGGYPGPDAGGCGRKGPQWGGGAGDRGTGRHGRSGILFIASGAFHIAKPSDLLPELQGRLPIRVELQPLTEADFVRILTVTENALTRQYSALLATEGVTVSFTPDGIAALAGIAAEVNRAVENIGARRLYTVMEPVFEELSFSAPDRGGEVVVVDAGFVEANLAASRSADLSRYVLEGNVRQSDVCLYRYLTMT